MNERITVYVNNEPVELYRGMEVRHALISYGRSSYEAAKAGLIFIVDENGFPLGLEGSLSDGAKIFSKTVARNPAED